MFTVFCDRSRYKDDEWILLVAPLDAPSLVDRLRGRSLMHTRVAKKRKPIDDLIDALVWIRRKAKERAAGRKRPRGF